MEAGRTLEPCLPSLRFCRSFGDLPDPVSASRYSLLPLLHAPIVAEIGVGLMFGDLVTPASLSIADDLCAPGTGCSSVVLDEDDVLSSPDFFDCLAGADLCEELPLIPDVAAGVAPATPALLLPQLPEHKQPGIATPASSSSTGGGSSSLGDVAAALLATSQARRCAAEAAQKAAAAAAAAASPLPESGGDKPLTKQQLAAIKRKAPEVDWRSIDDPEERRKQRRLAKNRITAARSRERKKEQLVDMGGRLAELEQENAQMRELLAALAQENSELRERFASLSRGAAQSPALSRSGPEPAALECVATNMHLAVLLLDVVDPLSSVCLLLSSVAQRCSMSALFCMPLVSRGLSCHGSIDALLWACMASKCIDGSAFMAPRCVECSACMPLHTVTNSCPVERRLLQAEVAVVPVSQRVVAAFRQTSFDSYQKVLGVSRKSFRRCHHAWSRATPKLCRASQPRRAACGCQQHRWQL